MNRNKFYFCATGNKFCRHNKPSVFCAPCYVCKVVRRFSHIHRCVNYFDKHPEMLDGLPEHWKSFSDRDWFPYVVGALSRPDERMRKLLLAEIGQPDMPERVWQFAISSFMLCLTYKWPPVVMSGTEDAWRLFRQHLIETYEDDLSFNPSQ